MNGLSTFQLVAACVHFMPALVWAIVAQHSWRFVRTRHPQSRFFRMLPIVGSVVALAYCELTVICLVPRELTLQRPAPPLVVVLYVLNDLFNFTVVALARHMARYFPTPEPSRPTPGWLLVNYGSSLLMDSLALLIIPGLAVPFALPSLATYRVLRWLYQLIMLGMVLWYVSRTTRPGAWGPGSAAWVPRRADVVFVGGGLLSLGAWMLILLTTNRAVGWEIVSPWGVALDAIAGVGFAVPLAVRILGEVVRGFLVVAGTLVATAAIYFGARPLGASFVGPELRPLLDVVTIFALALVFVPGQSWLRAAIDSLIFRRSRHRRELLQAFAHSLSPDLGTLQCCQHALAEVTDVMQLRGAAILLSNGDAAAHGAIEFAPIKRLWSEGTAIHALPDHALVGYELRELPPAVVEALLETTVAGVIPITSPRQRWGLLLISTSLLGATFREEDEQALQAFADQLALVLDGAELLARAVAVERSLAHREKLAGIGELAARIAHEIRNPVTAARSLAQQLARQPHSPLNAEHAGLILAELDRVERQVAALLRFARREDFHFEPLDLGEVTRATVAQLHSQLEAHAIQVHIDAAHGVTVRADREKIRQVLINLIENAVDALDETSRARRLALVVTRTNGSATLQVTDNGPGVPSDALPHLFEPFFSRKANGTGLGLAIAKRTIEAHGGRLGATVVEESGMRFSIDLPLVGAEGTERQQMTDNRQQTPDGG